MRIRAAVIHLCLPLSFASGFCPNAAAQSIPLPVPSFDLRVSLSEPAREMLNSRSEKITISVHYFGYAQPGVNVPADGAGRVALGSSILEIPPNSQGAHVPVTYGDKQTLDGVRSPLRLFINVQNPSLSCDIFEGPSKGVDRDPLILHCSLASETTGFWNSLVVIPKSEVVDSCAIYQLLLPGASSDEIALSQIQRWYLSNTTLNIHDMNPSVPPGGQLKPPSDNAVAFDQALQDFTSREQERVQIDPSCFQDNSLTLVDQRQLSNLRSTAGTGTGITLFSAVYFNDDETAALVYVNHWCANLCSAGQWVYLEKHSGQWVRRSGLTIGGA